MNAVFAPSAPRGSVRVPASKSCAHRLLICAAFAGGESVVRNVSFSEDILATLDCLRALGAEFSVDGTKVRIHSGKRSGESAILPCRESGSTLRFLIPFHGRAKSRFPRFFFRNECELLFHQR